MTKNAIANFLSMEHLINHWDVQKLSEHCLYVHETRYWSQLLSINLTQHIINKLLKMIIYYKTFMKTPWGKLLKIMNYGPETLPRFHR